MSIQKNYICNLCKDKYLPEELIGLYSKANIQGHIWVEKPARDVENHLCFKCLASIQALEQRCIAGFSCNGGVNCQSDHK